MFADDGSEIEFYGNNLWSYYDNIISSNALNFDYYGYDKEKKISAPKFKLSINGKTANKNAKLCFDSCSLYKFSYQLKSNILNHVKSDIEKFKTDQKWSHGFCYNGFKKNIYVTTMWNDLSNSPVVRFMIGEKERTILDSDKVYVPFVEFFSLAEILNQSFNNYVHLCSISALESNIVRLQKVTDNLVAETQSNSELPVLSDMIADSKPLETLNIQISGNQSPVNKVEAVIEKDDATDVVELAEVNAGKDSVVNQNDFDSFLTENRDSFQIDYGPEKVDYESKDRNLKDELVVKGSKFIDKLCNGDFTILEQMIFNASNEDLPFNSFVESVKQFTDIDFKDGISESDYLSLNYVISNNIKYNINRLLEKKVKLPSSITPIIVKNNKTDNDKIDTMYYLLLFYIYLSKIKNVLNEKSSNSLDNKEYFSYVIKTISNPLVFSYFPDIAEEVIKVETIKRFRILRNNDFFKNFENGIIEKLKINKIGITEEDIEDNITKIYDNVVKFKDKLGVQTAFNNKIMKVPYNTLVSSGITIKNLHKLIHFDSSFIKYGKINDKVDLKSYDDIPVNILKIYNIKTTKFDNTIIIKYFTDNIKNFNDLEKIKKINKNVYDIIDQIDITKYDDNSLKALYFWNVDQLPKDLTYFKFKLMVENSNLDRSELISMILNRTVQIDPDFYNSFLISANDDML